MKKKIFLLVILINFLFPAILLAQTVRGVTDTEVTIGVSIPMSGPAAVYKNLGSGAKAWAEHINAQGGIHGRKIKILMKDDGFNPTRTLGNFQEFKDKVFAISLLMGTPAASITKNFFAENKIPLIMPYSSIIPWTELPKDKIRYVFTAYPDYEDMGFFIAQYAIKALGSKKLTIFYQNDDFGKPGLAGTQKAVQQSAGKTVLVPPVSYEVTERALSAQALKLKESGADTVILFAIPLPASLLVKEMAKINYRPKVMAVFQLCDPVMFKLVGQPWEGTYAAYMGNSGVPGSSPEVDRVVDIILKYEPDVKGNEVSGINGAVAIMHLAQGLRNAGRNLTTESFIKGMEMIKDWQPEGIGAPVTYGPDRHHGNNALRMSQAKNGKYHTLTDWTHFKSFF